MFYIFVKLKGEKPLLFPIDPFIFQSRKIPTLRTSRTKRPFTF